MTKKIIYTIVLAFLSFNFATIASAQTAGYNMPYVAGTTLKEIKPAQSLYEILNFKTGSQDLHGKCQKFVQACIDDMCFRRRNREELMPTQGVVGSCQGYSINKFVQKVKECLPRYKSEQYDFVTLCNPYINPAIAEFRTKASNTNQAYASTTRNCIYAKKELTAAKACYSTMMLSDGSISQELYEKLNSLCGLTSNGGNSTVVGDFFNAGIYQYPDSQVIASGEADATFSTARQANWRQVVEGILAGYIEKAQSYCGDEDFEMTNINIYKTDDAMEEKVKQAPAFSAPNSPYLMPTGDINPGYNIQRR